MIREASAKPGRTAAGRATLIVAAALSAVLALALLFVPVAGERGRAHAVDANGHYTYSITLYPGNGTIEGANAADGAITIDGLAYGTHISLVLNNGNDEGTATINVGGSQYTVVPDDERYYPKGIRLAGDNEANIARPEFEVTQNEQYVVAYGLKQERVTYRVDYVDASGKALADSQFFYGNVGDKPVAAFQYIEGYVPNAYNITGTLDADESKNVFTFVYSPIAANATQVIYVNRGFALTTGPAVALQGAPGGVEGAAGADAVADAAAQEPVELIDLDDDETPLASGAAAEAGASAGSQKASPASSLAVVVSLAGLAVLFVILAVMLRRYLRKEGHQS